MIWVRWQRCAAPRRHWQAVAADDVPLRGDQIAHAEQPGAFGFAAELDDLSGEFVADHHRWLEPLAGPAVPLPEMEVGAADARMVHPNQYVARTAAGTGDVAQDHSQPRTILHQSAHECPESKSGGNTGEMAGQLRGRGAPVACRIRRGSRGENTNTPGPGSGGRLPPRARCQPRAVSGRVFGRNPLVPVVLGRLLVRCPQIRPEPHRLGRAAPLLMTIPSGTDGAKDGDLLTTLPSLRVSGATTLFQVPWQRSCRDDARLQTVVLLGVTEQLGSLSRVRWTRRSDWRQCPADTRAWPIPGLPGGGLDGGGEAPPRPTRHRRTGGRRGRARDSCRG